MPWARPRAHDKPRAHRRLQWELERRRDGLPLVPPELGGIHRPAKAVHTAGVAIGMCDRVRLRLMLRRRQRWRRRRPNAADHRTRGQFHFFASDHEQSGWRPAKRRPVVFVPRRDANMRWRQRSLRHVATRLELLLFHSGAWSRKSEPLNGLRQPRLQCRIRAGVGCAHRRPCLAPPPRSPAGGGSRLRQRQRPWRQGRIRHLSRTNGRAKNWGRGGAAEFPWP